MTNNEYTSYSKRIGFIAAAQMTVFLVRFIQLPVLTKTRWLDASLYGDWSIIYVSITLLGPLAALAMEPTLIRFLSSEKNLKTLREDFLSVLFTVLISGTMVSLILFLCSDIFATAMLHDINSSSLIKIGSFAVLTQALYVITVVFFRLRRQMKRYSTLIMLKPITELVLTVIFLSLGWAIKGVLIAILVSDILCILFALFLILRQIGFNFPRFTRIRGYLRYGLPIIPNEAMIWIITFSDRYLIGYFMEAEDVGIYTAAYRICNIIYLIPAILRVALFPTIAKLFDENNIEKTKTYLKYTLKYLMILSIPAAAGISILAMPLIKLFSAPEFVTGSAVMPYVSFGFVLFGAYHICVYTIYLANKTYWALRLLGISALLNIILNIVMIPHLGVVGAAIATLIAYGALGILTLLVSLRYIKFDLSISSQLKSVAAAAIMALCIWAIAPSGTVDVILTVLLGVLVYFATMVLFRGFSRREIALFKDLTLGFIRRVG
ncbi:flippase [Chloroflexota bacterium]